MRLSSRVLPAVLLLGITATSVLGLNPFLEGGEFGFGDAPLAEFGGEEVDTAEGETPPKIIIEKVIAYPANDTTNSTDVVVLRNVGGQTQDLKGWRLVDSEGDGPNAFKFGQEGCEDFSSIAPSEKLEILPETEDQPCGFVFNVNFRDQVSLLNAAGEVAANVSWDALQQGEVIKLFPDGNYRVLEESGDVIATLEALGNYTIFLQALEKLKLTEQLMAETDPDYDGVQFPEPPPPPPLDPQFPAWFGFSVNRSALPPPPPPPPPPPLPKEGVPKLGPYTLLAPDDQAFEDWRCWIAGPGKDPVTVEFILDLPELKDIILYHILSGAWTSENLKNNTAILTTKIADLVPLRGGRVTEGSILLHDSCVDKPTSDGISCVEQAEFGKCQDAFMVSPLAAQWPGGFCQKTCERCSCDPDEGSFCAEVVLPDVMAGNGVIHGISRILFAPPFFEPVEPLEPASRGKKKGKSKTPKSTSRTSGSASVSVSSGTRSSTNVTTTTTSTTDTDTDSSTAPKPKPSPNAPRTLGLRTPQDG